MSSSVGLNQISQIGSSLQAQTYGEKFHAVEQALDVGMGILQSQDPEKSFQVMQLNIPGHVATIINVTLTTTSKSVSGQVLKIQVPEIRKRLQDMAAKFVEFAKLIPQININQKKQIAQLEGSLKGNADEITKSSEKILKLTSEISRIKQENQELSQQVTKLSSQVQENSILVGDLTKNLESARASLLEAKNEASKITESSQQLEERLTQSEAFSKVLTGNNEKLIDQVKSNESTIADLQSKMSENNKSIEFLKLNKTEDSQQIQTLIAANAGLGSQIASLLSRNDELNQELTQNKSLLIQSEALVTELRELLSAAKEQNKKAEFQHQSRVLEFQAKISELNSQIGVLSKNNQDLNIQVFQLIESEKSTSNKQSVIGGLQEELRDAKEKLASANRLIEIHKNTIISQKSEIEQHKEIAAKANQRANGAADKIYSLEEQVATLQTTIEKSKKEFQELHTRIERSPLLKDLKNKETELEKTKGSLLEMAEANQNLTSQLEESQANLQSAGDNLSAVQQSLAEKNKLLQESADAINELTGKIVELSASSKQFVGMVDSIDILQKQLEEEKNRSLKLIKELEDLNQKFNESIKKISDLNNENRELNGLVTAHKLELETQEQVVEQTQVKNTALKLAKPATGSRWKSVAFFGSLFGNAVAAVSYAVPAVGNAIVSNTNSLIGRVSSISPQDVMSFSAGLLEQGVQHAVNAWNNPDEEIFNAYGYGTPKTLVLGTAAVVAYTALGKLRSRWNKPTTPTTPNKTN